MSSYIPSNSVSWIAWAGLRLALALATLGMVTAAQAGAPGKTAAPAPGSTNAGSAAAEIPRSVFTVSANPRECRDPFYPASTRFVPPEQSPTNIPPPSIVLELQGISGPPQHRLAIINSRTFEAGEENEVTSAAGRRRVRVLEIRDDSVVVEVGGERRVLSFRNTRAVK